MNSLFQIAEELRKKGKDCALCSIVGTKGSTPLKTGAKMLVDEDGNIHGTIGGGDLEKNVILNAQQVIANEQSELFSHHLLQQHGMCCGGTVNVFVDHLPAPARLYIFGAGHVGRALAKLSSELEFEVFVIDERKAELDKLVHGKANKLQFHHKEILPNLPFGKRTFIAIMTRDHSMDREILSFCIRRKSTYLGMIGSKRKVEVTRKMFLAGGICSKDEFEKVDAPMGIDIKAHSPEEIAVSILAKMIAVRNGGQEINSRFNKSTLNRYEDIET